MGNLELAIGTGTLGVDDSLGDSLAWYLVLAIICR